MHITLVFAFSLAIPTHSLLFDLQRNQNMYFYTTTKQFTEYHIIIEKLKTLLPIIWHIDYM